MSICLVETSKPASVWLVVEVANLWGWRRDPWYWWRRRRRRGNSGGTCESEWYYGSKSKTKVMGSDGGFAASILFYTLNHFVRFLHPIYYTPHIYKTLRLIISTTPSPSYLHIILYQQFYNLYYLSCDHYNSIIFFLPLFPVFVSAYPSVSIDVN